jgi:hypothetical protein
MLLSTSEDSTSPAARCAHGFTSTDSTLYLHGGYSKGEWVRVDALNGIHRYRNEDFAWKGGCYFSAS